MVAMIVGEYEKHRYKHTALYEGESCKMSNDYVDDVRVTVTFGCNRTMCLCQIIHTYKNLAAN